MKLIISGVDIYEGDLEQKYNSIFAKKFTDSKTGFSGNALRDKDTREIVIVYVGMQLKQKGKGFINLMGQLTLII